MRTINEISDAVRCGERLSTDDAITLWREAPLWLLGELATERKRKVSGEYVFYNRNVHLEPSNICLFNCEFCSFRRREGDADAWFMTLDEVEARAVELQSKDITEVHIVGGVHPSHTLDTYCEMIRRVKSALPHVSVKAYTAVELFYMIRKAEVTVVEGLRRLVDAGMDSIPGGGAEIFDEELRRRICPDKCSSDEWLAVHRAAHHMGIHTNCTMLYGHVESIEQRVDHLNRLRDLQDYAPGFDAFIPLKYRSRNNRMSEIGECSVEDDLRTIAMSRIFLDNIPHLKAYWVAYGKEVTELALAYGADDIDGTIDDSTKIYSMAGADARPSMSVEELESLVHDAGFVPVERDTHYNVVDRDGRYAGLSGLGVAASVVGVAAGAATAAAEVAEGTVGAAADAVGVAAAAAADAVAATEATIPDLGVDTNGDDNNDTESTEAVEALPVDGNNDDMAKKEDVKKGGFKEGLKRFWQGTKRAYKRFRILFHMFFIAIFLMLVVGALYLGLEWGTRHGEEIELPDFVGMDIDDARALAEEKGLEIIIREEVLNEDVEPGMIVEQNPTVDRNEDNGIHTVKVKPGRRIYVTIVSDKRDILTVPYVGSQSIENALQDLSVAGFTVGELIFEADRYALQVNGQLVNGREITKDMHVEMPRGTGVSLVVSYKSGNPNTQVPIVVGKSLSDARYALWKAGLNVGDISYDSSVNMVDRRNARVYMQSIAPNKRVRYGEVVELYLSEDKELIDSLAHASVDISKTNAAKANAEAKKREEQEAAERAAAEAEDNNTTAVEPESMSDSGNRGYDLQVDNSNDDFDDFFGA